VLFSTCRQIKKKTEIAKYERQTSITSIPQKGSLGKEKLNLWECFHPSCFKRETWYLVKCWLQVLRVMRRWLPAVMLCCVVW
jgi:hypothetical protein